MIPKPQKLIHLLNIPQKESLRINANCTKQTESSAPKVPITAPMPLYLGINTKLSNKLTKAPVVKEII